MLSDDEIEAIAQEHVRKNWPADCEILQRERRLEPDGIYFVANRRAPDFYVGSGGFFVARVSGEIWEFGSLQIAHEGLDYWLKWYAEGWRPGKCRLIVQQLKSPRRLAHLLVEQGVSYYMREVENDIVWIHEITADEEAVLPLVSNFLTGNRSGPSQAVKARGDIHALLESLCHDSA